MEAEQSLKRSKKPLIVAGAVAGILIVVGIAVFMAVGTPKKEAPATAETTTEQQQTVATTEEVQQNLKELDATIKQATADQAAAKASLKDGTNQIKVGS